MVSIMASFMLSMPSWCVVWRAIYSQVQGERFAGRRGFSAVVNLLTEARVFKIR